MVNLLFENKFSNVKENKFEAIVSTGSSSGPNVAEELYHGFAGYFNIESFLADPAEAAATLLEHAYKRLKNKEEAVSPINKVFGGSDLSSHCYDSVQQYRFKDGHYFA